MTTHVTEGARQERLFFLLGLPPSFLASCGFAAQCSSALTIPLLDLKKNIFIFMGIVKIRNGNSKLISIPMHLSADLRLISFKMAKSRLSNRIEDLR